MAVWESRVDLRQVFPAPRGPSRLGFARWLVGNIDHGLAEELLERVKASLPPADTSIATVEQTKRQVKDLLVLHGGVPSEAFSRDEMALLVTEASGIEGGSPLFCLLGLILHQLRGDLRMSFPDPAGVNRARFALWYVTSGWSEFDLPWALVAPVWRSLDWRSAVWAAWRARFWVRSSSAREQQRRTLREHFARAAAAPIEPERPQPASLPDGVNVIGWTNAATGVGEACRGSLAALAEARVVHAVWSLVEPGTPESLGHGAGSAGQPGAPYEVDLLHVNADMMRVITEALPSWVTAGRHRVGYWFWELSHFPLGFAPAFDLVDEVWAPTRFCLDAFAPLASVPVRWVPPSVPRQPVAAMARHDWGVPEASFLFLCAFDARSVPERKNPNGVLHAFALAVEAWRASAANRKPLHLLLKVNHGEEAPELLRELEGRAAGLPVTFSSATVPRQTIDSLIGGCDALLSLHRSEGLGLSLIEAMQLGRPVIATGYGGCSDFLDDETGWVVRHSLVPLRQAYGPYPAGAVWAEPDLGHAAELMVQVAGDAEGRERRAAAARRRVDEIYSPAAAGERFKREFDRILAARRGRAT